MDTVEKVLVGLLIFLAAVILAYPVYWVARVLWFRTAYGAFETTTGTVSNMDYTAPHTTVIGGKVTTVVTTPEVNDVYLSTRAGNFEINDEELYKNVRVGEKVRVEFQRVYVQRRFGGDGNWKEDSLRVLQVVNVQGVEIQVNDPKTPSPAFIH